MRIGGAAIHVPAGFDACGARAQSYYCKDFHYLDPLTEPSSAALAASVGRTVAVSETLSQSDMAMLAAREVLREGAAEQAAVDFIIYCHAGPDQAVASSPACRLQHELQRPGAFPFALGQQGTVAVFSALLVADSFFAAEGARGGGLIVAADRWADPLSRYVHDVTLSDGAGALFVTSTEGPGLEVAAVQVRQLSRATSTPASPIRLTDFAGGVAALIEATLDERGWSHDALHAVIGPAASPALAQEVHAKLGIAREQQMSARSHPAYLSSADPIAAVHQLLRSGEVPAGARVMVWDLSPTAHAGCALMTAR